MLLSKFIPSDKNIKISILGKSGSGKSFLLEKLLRRIPKYIIIDTKYEYGHLGFIVNDCIQLIHQIDNIGYTKIVFQHKKIEKYLPDIYRIMNTLENFYLVIEEMSFYNDTRSIDDELNVLIKSGRHENNGYIITTQRPADIHKSILAESNLIISFRQFEKNDLGYLSTCGIPVDKLPTIPKYYFLTYNTDTNESDINIIS